MEKRISSLFDYQKFAQNADLQAVIDAVHARYARRSLSLEEMELAAAAAGIPEAETGWKRPEKEHR